MQAICLSHIDVFHVARKGNVIEVDMTQRVMSIDQNGVPQCTPNGQGMLSRIPVKPGTRVTVHRVGYDAIAVEVGTTVGRSAIYRYGAPTDEAQTSSGSLVSSILAAREVLASVGSRFSPKYLGEL